MREPANLISGTWHSIAGEALRSHNPAHPDRTVWQGSPRIDHVDKAVAAARASLSAWSRTPIEKRAEALATFKRLTERDFRKLSDLLCDESGKAMWEAEAEIKLLGAKVDTTLFQGQLSEGSGRARVTPFEIPITATRTGRCNFRGHGAMAVLGPFNFPAHLPNGHIVPALLMGNTVIFKPSDKTPGIGQALAALYQEALESIPGGAPAGVFNLIHGAADVAYALVAHDGLDGILFTGSWPVGRRILEANLDRPGRIIALELGGNNASVVLEDADLKLAAIECARAAFATTGQRCTCTRRIIVHDAIAPKFIPLLTHIAQSLAIGDPRGASATSDCRLPTAVSQPFMGPLIRAEARDAVLQSQRRWISEGARPILESRALDLPGGGHYISPGILQVPRFEATDSAGCGNDIEVFGPIVRLTTVRNLDDAIAQANATRYGLAAAIFTRDPAATERFLAEDRAGCINVNTGTAGASGKLPFGGIGLSGNHRPAGAFALDYCAYPVASMIEQSADVILSPGMKFDEAWMG